MYSQNNEEQFILEYFGNKTDGRFLDIGAGDGKTFSNTRELQGRGWRGVTIEPDPILFGKLAHEYCSPQIIRYEAAFMPVGSPVKVPFHFCNGDFLGSTVEANLTKWPDVKFQKGFVTTVTANDIQKHAPFDFINIDTEGSTVDLLPELDRFMEKVQLVCIEHDNRLADIRTWCGKHGLTRELLLNGENILVGR